jgi:hypothetical protein
MRGVGVRRTKKPDEPARIHVPAGKTLSPVCDHGEASKAIILAFTITLN